MKNNHPPRWARWLLKRLSSGYQQDSAVIDLEDLYFEKWETEGPRAANRWYWRQVFRSLPSLIRHRMFWEGALAAQAIRVAWRRLRRESLTGTINLVGLSVGLTVAGLVAVWIHYEMSFDSFHREPHRIFRVAFRTAPNESYPRGFYGDYLPGPTGRYLQETYPAIESATGIVSASAFFNAGAETLSGNGYYVQPGFFQVFTFPSRSGSLAHAFDQPLSVVLTHAFSRRLFGEANPVGKTVKLDGETDFMVTGVVEDPPRHSSLRFDFLFPYRIGGEYLTHWNIKAARIFVRLTPEAHAEEVSLAIEEEYNNHNPGAYPNDLYLSPFQKMHLFELDGGGRITYVRLFAILALLILILAGINFTNLSTAWAAVRAKEMGIRRCNGALRHQLSLQILGETTFLALLSWGLALIAIRLGLPAASRLLNDVIPVPSTPFIPLGLLALALLVGLIAGMNPAMILSSLPAHHILSSSGLNGGIAGSKLLRRILVFIQFTLSIGFVVGVLVVLQQIRFIGARDLGYNRHNVVMVSLGRRAGTIVHEVKNELMKQPDVMSVSSSSSPLTHWTRSAGVDWAGKPDDLIFDVGHSVVDEDFAATLELGMAAGRFFSREFPSDRNSACVINQALARLIGADDPVGMPLVWNQGSPWEQRWTVVGVVKDYHTESLHKSIRPFIMTPGDGGLLFARLHEGKRREALGHMQDVLEHVAPDLPFQYNYLDDDLDALYRDEQLTGRFILLLTGLALIIACLGLIGLAAYSSARRLKEISIRKVLGASMGRILIMMNREFVVIVLLANVLAWPVAATILKRWLGRFAYHIHLSWSVFFLAGASALVIAILTVTAQSLRAACANPSRILKDE